MRSEDCRVRFKVTRCDVIHLYNSRRSVTSLLSINFPHTINSFIRLLDIESSSYANNSTGRTALSASSKSIPFEFRLANLKYWTRSCKWSARIAIVINPCPRMNLGNLSCMKTAGTDEICNHCVVVPKYFAFMTCPVLGIPRIYSLAIRLSAFRISFEVVGGPCLAWAPGGALQQDARQIVDSMQVAGDDC
jgi:hypothetical protein